MENASRRAQIYKMADIIAPVEKVSHYRLVTKNHVMVMFLLLS
jgi:hypothetical protein